jgi:hypothetical protein
MTRKIEGFSVDSSQLQRLNRFLLQDDFEKRINEARAINITITQKPIQTEFSFPEMMLREGAILIPIEKAGKYKLDPEKGELFAKKVVFSGYDESKYQFLTLEGIANITSHSIAFFYEDYIYPISKITFYFYTRSNKIDQKLGEGNHFIRASKKPENDINKDYAYDRNNLIIEHTIANSIIFIDGPMMGGNMTSYSLKLVNSLHKKNIIPIFFVKNSDSNLVVDYSNELKGNYNSDLHWSYNFLDQGQRTNLFKYIDKQNPANTKIFCYLKPFNFVTPQRIEIHPDTLELYKDYIDSLFDLIFYLIIVQGDKANPQIRPIAIAEKYAREVIHTINPESLLRSSSLIKTMDQSRFER